jgi:hypothetical protein
MSDIFNEDCLFIGGTADGKWLNVDARKLEHHLPSFSQQPALNQGTGAEPVPEASVAVEIYRRIEVEYDAGEEIAYVLNGMTEDAVTGQLMKHFGSAESAPMM